MFCGRLAGPALGGLLSDPCPRFSFLRDTSFCGTDSLLSQRCLQHATSQILTFCFQPA